MPENDAEKAGGDTGAAGTQTGGQGGNGNADDKAGKGETQPKGDDAGDDKAGQIVFASQKDFDAVIQRRIDRALKSEKEKAELSETDRLKKDAADARAEVRERDLRDDFVAKTNLPAGQAQRLFKMYRDDIDTDDNGKATNLDDVIKSAKKDFPDMFKPAPKVKGGGDGSEGTDGGKAVAGDMNAALRRMAGKNPGG